MKMLSKTTKKNFVTIGMVLVVYIIVSILMAGGAISSLIKGQLVPICAYVIMALSLNLTVGVLGELSLGHAGFMSVGAFSGVIVATLLRQSIQSELICLIIGAIVGGLLAALAGFLIGIPVLRLNGDYLAIVTLAFGEIIKSLVNNFYLGYDANGLQASFVTNELHLAEGGKKIVMGPQGISGIHKSSTFTFGIVLVVLCLIVIFNLIQSRTGRAIMALRDNRIAAESVGVNVTKYKLLVFSLSAGMAGVAGTLFAHNFSTIVATKFDFNTSILVLVFVVLGGLGNMRGSIIAATLLTLLPELLREFSNYRMLLYAVILILVMLGTNNPAVRDLVAKMTGKVKSVFAGKATKGGNANE